MNQPKDSELLAQWKKLWDDIHNQGGQTSSATQFMEIAINDLFQELKRRGLPVDYECPDPPGTCMYGCPGSADDWNEDTPG